MLIHHLKFFFFIYLDYFIIQIYNNSNFLINTPQIEIKTKIKLRNIISNLKFPGYDLTYL